MTNPTNTAAPGTWMKKLAPKTQKTLIAAAAAVVVIAAAGVAYHYFVAQPADEKAQTQLSTGLQLLNEAQQMEMQNVQVQAMSDSALIQALRQQGMLTTENADSVATFVNKFRADQKQMSAANYQKALKGDGKFPGLVKLAKGSGAGANMATYLAGVAYYHLGQYKEAIQYLEDYSVKGDKGVSPMALSALANSYACNGQIDKAIDAFKKAASKADNESTSPLFLIEAGKLLESQNKKEEAHKLYEQIKEDYPKYGTAQSGMGSSEIDKYLERTK
jgi:TolA-binding protein